MRVSYRVRVRRRVRVRVRVSVKDGGGRREAGVG